MQPATLERIVDAIEDWDGEDTQKLEDFFTTISATIAEPDKEAAYTMTLKILAWNFEDDLISARLWIYAALSGPADEIEENLDLAESLLEGLSLTVTTIRLRSHITAIRLRVLETGSVEGWEDMMGSTSEEDDSEGSEGEEGGAGNSAGEDDEVESNAPDAALAVEEGEAEEQETMSDLMQWYQAHRG